MSIMFIYFLVLFFPGLSDGFSLYSYEDPLNEQTVTYLHLNQTYVQNELGRLKMMYSANLMHIYCRRNQVLCPRNIFQSNQLKLIMAPNAQYKQYKAATARGVHQAHLKKQVCHEGQLLAGSSKVHLIAMSAHDHSCYGIYTDQAYDLTLQQLHCDEERVARFLFGIVLWKMSPMLSESLNCCYCLAMGLGVFLASLFVVCWSLIWVGDRQLAGFQPCGGNFKLLLERRTTLVALTLVFGAWLLLQPCKRYSALWNYPIVRRAQFYLLKLIAYVLICCASDHAYFGWYCVCLLLAWEQLPHLLHLLLLRRLKLRRFLLPTPENPHAARHRQRLSLASPSREQLAQLHTPEQFAQFANSIFCNASPRTTHRSSTPKTSKEVQTEQTDSAILEQLVTMANQTDDSSNNKPVQTEQTDSAILEQLAIMANLAHDSSSTEILCRNLRYTGSARSLRS